MTGIVGGFYESSKTWDSPTSRRCPSPTRAASTARRSTLVVRRPKLPVHCPDPWADNETERRSFVAAQSTATTDDGFPVISYHLFQGIRGA